MLLLALWGVLALRGLHAELVPAAPFSDNAVLQRDKPLPVWGLADAGEHVTVSFAGHTVSTTADPGGNWRVDLPPLPASGTPSDLVIRGKTTLTFTNIVVGEVWLASGQSNMEWAVRDSQDSAIEIAASARYPLIRHIVKPSIKDRRPWKVAGPTTTGGFTATGYFFARDLHQVLGVPVGIIHCAWGGTPIETWVPPESYKTIPDIAEKVEQRWAEVLAAYPEVKARYDVEVAKVDQEQAEAKSANRPYKRRWIDPPLGPDHWNKPGRLFTWLIEPLAPYALRGVVWYQGETNSRRAPEYHALFSALITGWREKFGQGDFPFYWAQLANFYSPTETTWAFLREAQTKTLVLPNTGQAVTIDVGDANEIHAANKPAMGRRLARIALARTYGFPVIDSGPVFAGTEREGSGFRVRFTETHRGLRTPFNVLGGFELAGADQVFRAADAKIDGATVLVSSAAVPEPVAVRYAWRNAPLAGLFNGEGLPAAPFRSDTW